MGVKNVPSPNTPGLRELTTSNFEFVVYLIVCQQETSGCDAFALAHAQTSSAR